MNKQIVPSLVAVLLLAGGFWFLASGTRPMPEVSFTLTDGRQLHSTDLRGRSVLFNFWSVSCEVCLRDMPTLARVHEEMRAQGLEVIGVAMPQDPPPAVMATVKRLAPPYPIALDVNGELNRAFGGVQVTPTNILVGPDGNINYSERGPVDETRLRATILTFQR